MSAEAVGWVYRYSPYKGAEFAIHLAIADSVSDLYENSFFMRLAKLGRKARVSRETASRAIGKMIEQGFLEASEGRSKGGFSDVGKYHFLMPVTPQVFDPKFVPTVTTDHGDDPTTVTTDHGTVTTDHGDRDDRSRYRSQLDTKKDPNTFSSSPSAHEERIEGTCDPIVTEPAQSPIIPPGLSHPAATTGSAADPGAIDNVVGMDGKPVRLDALPAKVPVDQRPDPEVVRLCALLADLYRDLGNTRPNPDQQGWYRACRLLLTKDGPEGTGWSTTQIEAIMRWALADSFWQSNIRSMPKLRAQFDQLRMKRNADLKKKTQSSAEDEDTSWMARTSTELQ